MSIAIIGGGIVGLTAAAYLKHNGIDDFIVLEEEDEVGGTWRDHDYPGAGTDTEAPSYIPTFLPIPDFKYQFATRAEIFAYIKDVMAKQYVGYDRIRLGHRVTECRFASDDMWHIRADTASGTTTFQVRFVIIAWFSLSKKHLKVPEFPDRERFAKTVLHSSQLTSDLSQYADKDVVVVGCGATAVQLVPSIAGIARTVTVLRRTMPYISLKQRKPAPKTRLEWALNRFYYELRNDVITSFDWARGREWILRRWVWFTQYQLPMLTGACAPLPESAYPLPEQPVQCTRRAFDYLGFRDSLSKPNVNLIDLTRDPIKGYVEEGIALESGQVRRADLIILATGYHLLAPQAKIIVNDEQIFDNVLAPNLFIPLLGGPLFTIPPRVCEDSMAFFVREYRRHETARQIFFLDLAPRDIEGSIAKAQKNHVVFSPHCSSVRYFKTSKDAPDARLPYVTQDFEGGGIPRILFNMLLKLVLSPRVVAKTPASQLSKL